MGLSLGVNTLKSGISPSSGADNVACGPKSRCSHINVRFDCSLSVALPVITSGVP